MSWSGSGKATVEARDGAQVAVVVDFQAQPQSGNGESESKEAIAAVEEAIHGLLGSGAFGIGNFEISASGHANADHKPVEGWANDGLYGLRISQVVAVPA